MQKSSSVASSWSEGVDPLYSNDLWSVATICCININGSAPSVLDDIAEDDSAGGAQMSGIFINGPWLDGPDKILITIDSSLESLSILITMCYLHCVIDETMHINLIHYITINVFGLMRGCKCWGLIAVAL